MKKNQMAILPGPCGSSMNKASSGAKSFQLVILVGESHNDSSSDVGTLFQVRFLNIIPQFNDFFSKILY